MLVWKQFLESKTEIDKNDENTVLLLPTTTYFSAVQSHSEGSPALKVYIARN